MIRFIIILVFSFFVKAGFSQTEFNYPNTGKGQLYISWGWNRDAFTKSNLKLKGNDYDLVLKKIKAHDRPTKVSFKNYLQPDRITIPQTNFRIGYFIRKDLAVTFGFDHMKYVMDNNQTVYMKGFITRDGSYKRGYDGYNEITEDFLTFEHTDGLNYINVEVEKYKNLYHTANDKIIIDALFGAGAGILMPRTNVHLLNYEISDRFHISGYGLGLKAGIQATFFKHLNIRVENKYGYINMPNIVLHKKGTPGLGKQTFMFTQFNSMIGYVFLFRHKKRNKRKEENN